MDSLNAETADEIADEVARLAQTMKLAIDQISRTARDPACNQAAQLAVAANLLARAVTSEATMATVNVLLTARGLRVVRVH